jgi:hypothetical protein
LLGRIAISRSVPLQHFENPTTRMDAADARSRTTSFLKAGDQ